MPNETVDNLLAEAIENHDKVNCKQICKALGLLTPSQIILAFIAASVILTAAFNLGIQWERLKSSVPKNEAASDSDASQRGDVNAADKASRRQGLAGMASMDADQPPSDPPLVSVISDMPSREVVANERPAISPSDAQLWYKNGTAVDLKLFLLDVSKYYADGDGYWFAFPLVPGRDFELWDRFPEKSSGWYCFIVRDLETGKDTSLGCRAIFRKATTHVTVTGESGGYSIQIE